MVRRCLCGLSFTCAGLSSSPRVKVCHITCTSSSLPCNLATQRRSLGAIYFLAHCLRGQRWHLMASSCHSKPRMASWQCTLVCSGVYLCQCRSSFIRMQLSRPAGMQVHFKVTSRMWRQVWPCILPERSRRLRSRASQTAQPSIGLTSMISWHCMGLLLKLLPCSGGGTTGLSFQAHHTSLLCMQGSPSTML